MALQGHALEKYKRQQAEEERMKEEAQMLQRVQQADEMSDSDEDEGKGSQLSFMPPTALARSPAPSLILLFSSLGSISGLGSVTSSQTFHHLLVAISNAVTGFHF